MKIFLGFLLSLILLAGGGFGAYQLFMSKKAEEAETLIPFTNPFVEKPDASFANAQTDVTNPFEETPSANPFESTESSEYQNPFEALR